MTENSTFVADYRQMDTYMLATAGVGIAVILMILEFIALGGMGGGLFPSVSADENFRRRSLPNTKRINKGDKNYVISKSAKRERRKITESSNSKTSRRIQASLI